MDIWSHGQVKGSCRWGAPGFPCCSPLLQRFKKPPTRNPCVVASTDCTDVLTTPAPTPAPTAALTLPPTTPMPMEEGDFETCASYANDNDGLSCEPGYSELDAETACGPDGCSLAKCCEAGEHIE